MVVLARKFKIILQDCSLSEKLTVAKLFEVASGIRKKLRLINPQFQEKMPSSPPGSNGQSRFNGQEVLDLGVCLQIVKKALVTLPIIIMIVLYVIRSYAHAHAPKDSIATNSSLIVTDEQNTSNSQQNSSFLDPR